MSEMSPAEEVFFAALERPSPADRAAYLDEACACQPELRARVEKMLAAHPRVGAFLESDAPADTTHTFGDPATASFRPAPTAEEAEGAVIAGRYKLRQQIGEGGMGTVWMADQTEPVKRKVAVKLIRLERGQSKTMLARFEAERQAIALMDHPHIAKLLDAGTTDTGAPFFVMELVKGVPLNEFCDEHKLTIADRLNLFRQICSAVQHAHQKGIIHRDLKPGNILVESHDGKPVPKVIDFGLAKATTGLQLTDQSMFTAFGSVMGTPLYMAPEQATFNAVDVDTRADVYALGVILYELLTGTTPLTKETLKKAALDEMLRLVREQEAPTPSSRLSSAESAPGVAANRQIEPAKLGRFVKGELDWIVMKALAKERDRRYETANGFAKDIERFLNHEPVTAGPPSKTYRLKKFVRRNRPQVIAASLVLVALVGGVVGTTLGLVEARKQEAEARRQEGIAREQEAEAMRQEAFARQQAANARLEADAKERARAAEEKQRLAAVAEKKRADEQTKIALVVRDFVWNKLLAQADTMKQADALLRVGGQASAVKLNPTIRELLDRAARELTPDRIEANFPKQPLVQAELLRTVGDAYRGIGETGTAIGFLTRSTDLFRRHLGPDHAATRNSMSNLAVSYQDAGKHDLALPLHEEEFKRSTAKLGPDHDSTLIEMNNLAHCHLRTGKLDLALPLFEEAVKRSKSKFGPDHLTTLISMCNLAEGYRVAGKLDLALPLFEETLNLQKAKLGPDHPHTLLTMGDLATAYLKAGKSNQALLLWEETLTLHKSIFGPDHTHTLVIMGNLAVGYHDNRQYDRSLPLFEETFKLRQAKLGPDHADTIKSMSNLAQAYKAVGKLDLALPLIEEKLKMQRAKIGPDHPQTLTTIGDLASGYLNIGKLDLALPLFEEAVKHLKAKLGPDRPGTPQLASSLATLGLTLVKMRRYAEAEEPIRECLAIREKQEPDAWTTFNTQSMLGGALLGQKKYADAEPLLLKGYDGMKAREKTIPPEGIIRVPEALNRLIELYTAINKPDEVKKYRDLRALYPTPREVAPIPKEKK